METTMHACPRAMTHAQQSGGQRHSHEQRPDPVVQLPYQHAVDSIKKASSDQGYVLLREASIQMQSEYEMPVVLPMQAGTVYQFVFIGDPSSKLYEVRMYDWNERQVIYKKNQWGDVDGSIISYTYVPQFSEYHMIKPVQVNKNKKKLCGYVMLLKKPEPTAKK